MNGWKHEDTYLTLRPNSTRGVEVIFIPVSWEGYKITIYPGKTQVSVRARIEENV